MHCTINIVGTKLDIKMSGKCSVSDYDYFQQLLEASSAFGLSEIRVFLGELDYIDSSGLSMLLMLRERSTGRLTLIAPKGQVARMLYETQLIDAFNIEAQQCVDSA